MNTSLHKPKARLIVIASLALFAGISPKLATAQPGPPDPFGPRITSTRWAMAFGRADRIRSRGIFVPGSNPRGFAVSRAFKVIKAINNQRRITLGLDRDGRRMVGLNPISLAATKLSSGMSLVVAELGPRDVFGGWKYLTTRFGSGNLYATVNIPERGIARGMELRTYKQMREYDANSILYEAPDLGNLVVDHRLKGGWSGVTAVINGRRMSTKLSWASRIDMVLSVVSQHRYPNGLLKIRLMARLPMTFAFPNCRIRWAAESNGPTVLGEVGVAPVRASRRSLFKVAFFDVKLRKETKGNVKVSAVASTQPFLNPIRQGWFTLNTFHSSGSTLEDTISFKAKKRRFYTKYLQMLNHSNQYVDIAIIYETIVGDKWVWTKVYRHRLARGGSRYPYLPSVGKAFARRIRFTLKFEDGTTYTTYRKRDYWIAPKGGYDAKSRQTFKWIINRKKKEGGLTDVVVNRSPVLLKVWDHSQQDGDIVKVFVNGRFYKQISLTNRPQSMSLPLPFGSHTFRIQAVNQGSVGPNTASMSISAVTSGRSQQKWDLKTGQSASMQIHVRPN